MSTPNRSSSKLREWLEAISDNAEGLLILAVVLIMLLAATGVVVQEILRELNPPVTKENIE
jgi:DNA-binding transcriptional regulator YbjK